MIDVNRSYHDFALFRRPVGGGVKTTPAEATKGQMHAQTSNAATLSTPGFAPLFLNTNPGSTDTQNRGN